MTKNTGFPQKSVSGRPVWCWKNQGEYDSQWAAICSIVSTTDEK
ncbi:hypothetical protein ACLB1N_00775 [Escherichia coli]